MLERLPYQLQNWGAGYDAEYTLIIQLFCLSSYSAAHASAAQLPLVKLASASYHDMYSLVHFGVMKPRIWLLRCAIHSKHRVVSPDCTIFIE